jgi:hypothetical protein
MQVNLHRGEELPRFVFFCSALSHHTMRNRVQDVVSPTPLSEWSEGETAIVCVCMSEGETAIVCVCMCVYTCFFLCVCVCV